MRRYPFVIGATAAGLAGVLSFHTHGTSLPASQSSLNPGPSASSSPSSQAPPATQPQQASPSPATAPAQGATASSATGTLEQYGYGQLSVRVTLSGGRITAATIATLQTLDTYSQQLAGQAVPILEREVLSAQSARIDSVSGATYTSQAYAASLQAALDALKK